MEEEKNYQVPAGTKIGHVHLKVADLERSLQFYCGLPGFSLTQRHGEEAAFICAGAYHHHIGLNTWYSKGGSPAPAKSAGLFHTAILYETRRDLAEIFIGKQSSGYHRCCRPWCFRSPLSR
jgi:catechol 2,3-dioxygenase